jgi:hypothetical protein
MYIKRMDYNVETYIAIIDARNLKWKNYHYKLSKDIIETLANYFPERSYKIYIINTNSLLKIFWSILRSFVPRRT